MLARALGVGEGLLGALDAHDGKRVDDKLLKAGNLRKVLAPHLLVAEHVVHQLGIVCTGVGGVEIEHEGIVLRTPRPKSFCAPAGQLAGVR